MTLTAADKKTITTELIIAVAAKIMEEKGITFEDLVRREIIDVIARETERRINKFLPK